MHDRFVAKLLAFGLLEAQETAALTEALGTPKKVAANTDLIREGDRPGPMFVMLDGWACRYKILPNGGRQIVGYLMPGDHCDLNVGLLAEMDHSIQTLTAAFVAKIDRTTLDGVMDAHPKIAKAMYLSQLVDEGTMRAWITSMGRRSSIERVAHLICELYVRARTIGLADSSQLDLPLTQLMLADSLGMTPVYLNRVLRELRKSGAMTLKRNRLSITDPVALIQIAGFNENYLHKRLRAAA